MLDVLVKSLLHIWNAKTYVFFILISNLFSYPNIMKNVLKVILRCSCILKKMANWISSNINLLFLKYAYLDCFLELHWMFLQFRHRNSRLNRLKKWTKVRHFLEQIDYTFEDVSTNCNDFLVLHFSVFFWHWQTNWKPRYILIISVKLFLISCMHNLV